MLPSALELDALPIMFGGVDRSGPDDVDPRAVTRPKKNVALPGRFLNRVYAIPNVVFLSLPHVSGGPQSGWVNNVVMCLCYISDMKKTGYVCYPCWKENGHEKPYSRSYDLIAHIVNMHEKYPDGAVNKTAYSTDGTNVRDTTEEEKVRYRDANKHRRKKVDEKYLSGESRRSRNEVPAEAPPMLPLLARSGSSTSKNKERG